MSHKEDVRREKLHDVLDVLKSEVQSLVINRHVFWEVQDIIRKNQRIQIGSTFYDWMGSAYATSMSVAVRRQVDEDSRSISFVNFLKQIQARPHLVSRAWYKSLFANGNYPANWPDACFDRLAGRGQQHVQADFVASEIVALKARTKHVARYVNKRVAHRDAHDFRPLPKFRDIDAAVGHLDRLTVRYLNLLRGMSLTTTLPTWQYDWKEIFRHAWLVEP